MDRSELIREKLLALQPSLLILEDESYLHKGHAGARDGRGHFALTISSDAFNGKTKLQQHQMIYKTLGELMETEIHALRICVKGDVRPLPTYTS